MEYTDKLTHDPVRHRQHGDRIHVVRVHITAYVTDVAIVAHVVESGQQTGNCDLKAVWHVRQFVLFQILASKREVRWLARCGGVGTLRLPVENCVDDFAESTTIQFRRQPSLLKEVLNDGSVFLEKRISQARWNG